MRTELPHSKFMCSIVSRESLTRHFVDSFRCRRTKKCSHHSWFLSLLKRKKIIINKYWMTATKNEWLKNYFAADGVNYLSFVCFSPSLYDCDNWTLKKLLRQLFVYGVKWFWTVATTGCGRLGRKSHTWFLPQELMVDAWNDVYFFDEEPRMKIFNDISVIFLLKNLMRKSGAWILSTYC
jgi:hypothetical protein